uniref:hypothetical protein n=1 Tax=Nocardia asiatica TaxID=209252 RepID=UPI0024542FD1
PYGFSDPAVVGFNLGEKVITLPAGLLIVFYCFAYFRLLSGTPAHPPQAHFTTGLEAVADVPVCRQAGSE